MNAVEDITTVTVTGDGSGVVACPPATGVVGLGLVWGVVELVEGPTTTTGGGMVVVVIDELEELEELEVELELELPPNRRTVSTCPVNGIFLQLTASWHDCIVYLT